MKRTIPALLCCSLAAPLAAAPRTWRARSMAPILAAPPSASLAPLPTLALPSSLAIPAAVETAAAVVRPLTAAAPEVQVPVLGSGWEKSTRAVASSKAPAAALGALMDGSRPSPEAPEAVPAGHTRADGSEERYRSGFRFFRTLFRAGLRFPVRHRYLGIEKIPKTGPAMLLFSHPTWADVWWVMYVTERPYRLWLFQPIAEFPIARIFLRKAGVIPVTSKVHGASGDVIRKATAAARQALQDGQLVMIAPEGGNYYNGNMLPFKKGFTWVGQGLDVAAYPIHLDGLWDSIFSRRPLPLTERLRRWFWPMTVRVGEPLREISVQAAREEIQALGAKSFGERVAMTRRPLPLEFIGEAKRAWRRGRGEELVRSILLSKALAPHVEGQERVGLLLGDAASSAEAALAAGFAGKTPAFLSPLLEDPEALERAIARAGLARVWTDIPTARRLHAASPEAFRRIAARLIYTEALETGKSAWQRFWTGLALRWLPAWMTRGLYGKLGPRSLEDTAALVFPRGAGGRGLEFTHQALHAQLAMRREVAPFQDEAGPLSMTAFLGDLAMGRPFGDNGLGGFARPELGGYAALNLPDVRGRQGELLQTANKPGTAGHPLPGTAVRIVDPVTYAPVPDGKPGLLLVASPGLMKGYLLEPEASAGVLRDGWLVTGATAIAEPDGFLRIVEDIKP